MPITATYKPDHIGIRDFLHGPEIRKVNLEAAADVVQAASGKSKSLDDHWHVEEGPDITIGLYSRATGVVLNDAPNAASIEFGSGTGREGGTPRKQGGYSNPQRILGKAGQLVGDYRGELG